jgi:hypothetical protein
MPYKRNPMRQKGQLPGTVCHGIPMYSEFTSLCNDERTLDDLPTTNYYSRSLSGYGWYAKPLSEHYGKSGGVSTVIAKNVRKNYRSWQQKPTYGKRRERGR